MPTNQQRREAERRRLQQQLAERRARQQARRRRTLITSVIGTVALIAAVVIIAVVVSSHKSTPTAGKTSAAAAPPTTAAASTPATPSTSAPALPTAACGKPGGNAVTFRGVRVSGATDLKHGPKITSKATAAPPMLQCADLVVGTGAVARPTSMVSVRYTGVLYRNGTQFDSSWKKGSAPISFSLTGVVPGFTQGIGGAGAVAPMRVGGRRLMILPSALGYGAQGNGPIPPNAPLVFIVDLVKVTG